jgi:hypothetical protein
MEGEQMKRALRKAAFMGAVAVAGVAATAGPAFANDCANVSRAPAKCGYTCDGIVAVGNWVWLPSLPGGINNPPIWGFGAPENFTNGKTDALTANGNANSGGAVCATPNRQFTPTLEGMHGVLSSEACGIPN